MKVSDNEQFRDAIAQLAHAMYDADLEEEQAEQLIADTLALYRVLQAPREARRTGEAWGRVLDKHLRQFIR